MPPLPADSIHARACKLKCEKILTRPWELPKPLFFASPILRWKGRNLPAKEVEKSIFKSKQPVAC